MAKQISATDAKNNFGGLLEDVAVLGRVDIVRHGRLVAIVLSPLRAGPMLEAAEPLDPTGPDPSHMIPRELARAARVRRPTVDFDDD